MEMDFNYGARRWRVINIVYFAKVIWHSDVWIIIKYVWYFLEGHKEPLSVTYHTWMLERTWVSS